MVRRYVRIGAVDDGWGYDDIDFDSAIETTETIKCGPPLDGNEVVRLDDLYESIEDRITTLAYFFARIY